MTSQIVVSITSIPPRLKGLGATLESLLDQREVAAVSLCLPKRWRDLASPQAMPKLPKGVTLHRLQTDYGPATKVIGALETLAYRDAPFLIADDDWIYGDGWAAAALSAGTLAPGAACAGSVFCASRLGLGGGTILQGFAGALLRTSFFGPERPGRSESLVDDIWISAQLAKRKIQIVEVPKMRRLITPSGNDVVPLQHRTDRGRLNKEVAKTYQRHFEAAPKLAQFNG